MRMKQTKTKQNSPWTVMLSWQNSYIGLPVSIFYDDLKQSKLDQTDLVFGFRSVHQ